jgi:hypothetical protein
MKKLLFILLLFTGYACGQTTTVSQLPAADSVKGADLFLLVQDGTSKKLTFTNLRTGLEIPAIDNASLLNLITAPYTDADSIKVSQITTIQSTLAGKSDSAWVLAKLTYYGDTSYVTTRLSSYATITLLNSSIAPLALKTYVDSLHGIKITYANLETVVQDSIAKKANTTDINASLDLKADIVYVDSLHSVLITYSALAQDVKDSLLAKANLTYVSPLYDSVALKANKTYVDPLYDSVSVKANLTDIADFVDSAYVQSLITAGATDTTYVKNTISDSLALFTAHTIANNTIDSNKIIDGTVSYADIKPQSIRGGTDNGIEGNVGNILDYSITNSDIEVGAVSFSTVKPYSLRYFNIDSTAENGLRYSNMGQDMRDTIAAKANLIYTNTQLGAKADTSQVTALQDSVILKANLTYVNTQLATKADSNLVIIKGAARPYVPSDIYDPANKSYVDSAVNKSVVYFSTIQNEEIDWSKGTTFYTILQDTASISFTNIIPGKRIELAIENPSTYPVTFNNPTGKTILWLGGSTPTQADSAVDVWKFNSVGSYILGERAGSYALPIITPPDTSTPPPTGIEYYLNTEYADLYYVNPTKQQILDGTTLPVNPVKIGSAGITVKLARGEFEPFSFLIVPKKPMLNVETTVGTLSGVGGSLTSDIVDRFYVLPWWQENFNYEGRDIPGDGTSTPQIIQELLVKDPTLVTNGSTQWADQIKGLDVATNTTVYKSVSQAINFKATFKIQDASTFQKININDGRNKQLYFVAKLPPGTSGGNYYGEILVTFNNGADTLARIPLTFFVRDYDLPESRYVYGLYNDIMLETASLPYSANWYAAPKDSTQLEIELKAIYDMGIRYPMIGQNNTSNIAPMLRFMNRNGFPTDKRFLHTTGASFSWYYNYIQQNGGTYATAAEVKAKCVEVKNAAIANGLSLTNTYFYGMDEANMAGNTTLDNAVAIYDEMNTLYGMKFYQAISNYGFNYSWGNFNTAKNDLQIPIYHFNHYGYYVDAQPAEMDSVLKLWKANGNQVYIYNYPQHGKPIAENYRRNSGFMLWKYGADGAFPWKLGAMNGLWYDHDGAWPDPAPFYSTYHGVVKTVSYEGQREAVDDSRYLTKFLDILDTLSDATAKSTAESWLNTNFKSWLGIIQPYTTGYPNGGINADSLDFLRDTLAGYIAYLSTGAPEGGEWYDIFDSVSTITIATDKIDGTLSDFPITLDLSTLGDNFWNTVSTASEIAFSDNSNAELDRYIAGFDDANKKGVAYFRAPTLSDANNVFKIWWGGSGQTNKSSTFRSEYELVLGFNEDYNAIVDYTGKHTLAFGAGRVSGDKVAGKIGYAADFDNTANDSIRVLGSMDIGTGDMSLTAYTNLNAAASGYAYLLNTGANTNTEAGYYFGWYVTGLQPAFGLSDGATRQSRFGTAISTLLSDGWKHIGFGLYRTAQKKWWVNGTPDLGTTTTFFSGTNIISAKNSIIGGGSGLTAPFYGQIDELRLYKGQLSDDWEKTEYNNLSNQATFFTIQ